jgi:ribosomal protein S18 acetylase RimI-like enzyme
MTLPSDYKFRAAVKSDCRRIAELYSISSDGVADYIWTKLAEPGEDILDVGTRRYEQENSPFSYHNVTVVQHGGEVIGMLVAFPLFVDPDEVETDPVLAPYSKLEEDNSYYICGVCILPGFRGQGLGKQLMVKAEQDASDKGFNKLSLIVFEANEGAKKLYDNLGYQVTARAAIHPHPLIHYTGDALLMAKTLG